jgi:hypothetical protein
MATRQTVLRTLIEQIYPLRPGETKRSEDVDFHLLAVMLLLSTRGDVLARVFPASQATDPRALYELGVDSTRIPPALIEPLRIHREAFAAVQIAWLDLAGYTDPPCPPDPIANRVVERTKDL